MVKKKKQRRERESRSSSTTRNITSDDSDVPLLSPTSSLPNTSNGAGESWADSDIMHDGSNHNGLPVEDAGRPGDTLKQYNIYVYSFESAFPSYISQLQC